MNSKPLSRTIWREPAAETEDYPNVVVSDDRVSGSLTLGRTRLPLWCFIPGTVRQGWPYALDQFPQVTEYGWDGHDAAQFIYDLLELRGEFARLLCVLADVERRDSDRAQRTTGAGKAWWDTGRDRKRVINQMRRCIAALGGEA